MLTFTEKLKGTYNSLLIQKGFNKYRCSKRLTSELLGSPFELGFIENDGIINNECNVSIQKLHSAISKIRNIQPKLNSEKLLEIETHLENNTFKLYKCFNYKPTIDNLSKAHTLPQGEQFYILAIKKIDLDDYLKFKEILRYSFNFNILYSNESIGEYKIIFY